MTSSVQQHPKPLGRRLLLVRQRVCVDAQGHFDLGMPEPHSDPASILASLEFFDGFRPLLRVS